MAGRQKRTLLVLPTGCGKQLYSVRSSKIGKNGRARARPCPSGELLDQASDKLEKSTGLKTAVEKRKKRALEVSFGS